MGRVPRDRHHGAGLRRRVARKASASSTRCAARSARTCIAQYVQRLQTDIGATINQDALRQVVVGRQRRPELAMQIEPAADAFAARYARGEPQVVWTTLVADLETPVSAFLKVAGGRANSFLFESVEGGATRGRYSIIGLEPDLVWRAQRHARRDQPRGARTSPTRSPPAPSAPLAALRALIAESRIVLPEKLPPMAAGLFGYLGYDMVRLMEELPARQSRSDRHSGRDHDPPDRGDRVRRRAGHDHDGDAGAARGRRRRVGCVQPRDRAALRDRRRARPAARQGSRRRDRRPARRAADLEHHAGRIQRDGRARQGIHRGRRHLPGGAVAALRGAVHALAVRALPRAAPGQSGAVPVLPRFRRLRDRRIEPGDPGARARRHRHGAPDRRHAPSRRDPARGQGAGGASCSPIRRSAPST